MKQKILEALKAKFEGVSEQILGRIADKLAKTATTAEQVSTAVEGVTIQQVIDSYGDSRATEAQQTAVRNYEQKYGLKDGKAIEGGEPADAKKQPKSTEDAPDWAQSIMDANKALTERLNKLEMERTSTSRRQKLNAEIENLPATLRKAYERTSIDTLTEEEFDTLLSEVKTEVEQIGNDINAKGAVFGKPNAVGGKQQNANPKEASESETDAVVGKLINV